MNKKRELANEEANDELEIARLESECQKLMDRREACLAEIKLLEGILAPQPTENEENLNTNLSPEVIKRKSRFYKIMMKATLTLIGLSTLGYTAGRYNDKANKIISEYIDEDLANITRLPLKTGLTVMYNGICKRLGIGYYAKDPKTKPIAIEIPSDTPKTPNAKADTTSNENNIAPEIIERPLINSYVIGENVGNYRGREIKPFVLNMQATDGYTLGTYENLDGLGQGDPLKDREGTAILGGLRGTFAPFKATKENTSDSSQLYLVMQDNHRIIIKKSTDMKSGEMAIWMHKHFYQTRFEDIDVRTESDGTQTVATEYDDNLNTAALRGTDGKYEGIGLTHYWDKRTRIPLNEAVSYSQSRGGMVFIYSEDLKDQYAVGGSFYTMWDVYSKLKKMHPERKYYMFRNDYGSYAASMFGNSRNEKGNKIISVDDQQAYSAQNSYGPIQMLILKLDQDVKN